jgi:selenocysteine lyase/cysteine desulfurase
MIPCQRELFEMPEDVAYFNCAYTSPLLRSAAAAGRAALAAKSHPWTITSGHFFETIEACRTLFGRLIGSTGDNVAIVPAVSYGIALAARNLPLAAGQTIVVLEDQFPSNVYSWRRLTAEKGAILRTVHRPADGDWTAAILDCIDRKTAVAALPNCHWTDGSLIDLEAVSAACRQAGAALVVDGTQSLGAMPFALDLVQPDFLVATAHKWLLGPYSFGFCYVAPRYQSRGVPLEENWLNRSGSQDFARLVDYRDDYQPGARRFDVGEVSNFILAPIAAAALSQLLSWGMAQIAKTLRAMTVRIARRAEELGFRVPPERNRAPHLLGLTLPGGLPEGMLQRLMERNVFASVRGSAVRVAPHLYNTEADLERLFAALAVARERQPGCSKLN